MQDPEIRDLTIDLASVAGRLAAMCGAKGVAATREELVESVLSAIEDAEDDAPDGVASLARARKARGLPVLARPVGETASGEPLEVLFKLYGEPAKQIRQMAVLLHGEATEATCSRVTLSATERGIASLKRELNID